MKTSFEKLKQEIHSCRDCLDLFGFEPVPVFQGNKNAKIFQISQAPSKKVQDNKKSFTDASGKKLKTRWYKIPDKDFYNESNFYISGVAHCYPGKNPNGGDRPPPKHCADKWLTQEIKLANNKIFVLHICSNNTPIFVVKLPQTGLTIYLYII